MANDLLKMIVYLHCSGRDLYG